MRVRHRWLLGVIAAASILIAVACDDFSADAPQPADAGQDSSSAADSDVAETGDIADTGMRADGSGANDAAADAADAGDPCSECRSKQCFPDGGCFPVVFVTNETYDGDFRFGGSGDYGPSHADDLCNLAAGNGDGGPRSTFRAWLGTTQKAPLTRVTEGFVGGASRPVVDLAGRPIASSYLGMVATGMLENGITLSQNGVIPAGEAVWTGAEPDGTKAAENCGDFTVGNSSKRGTVGRTGAPGKGWSASDAGPCNELHHLYCFEGVP